MKKTEKGREGGQKVNLNTLVEQSKERITKQEYIRKWKDYTDQLRGIGFNLDSDGDTRLMKTLNTLNDLIEEAAIRRERDFTERELMCDGGCPHYEASGWDNRGCKNGGKYNQCDDCYDYV